MDGEQIEGADEMNFELPEELRMLKDNVRRFVDRELIPIEREVCTDNKIKPQMRELLEGKAKALGLWLYDVPQVYGGQGLGLLAKVVVWSELGGMQECLDCLVQLSYSGVQSGKIEPNIGHIATK